MDFSKKQLGIFYLEGNRAIFYGGNVVNLLSLEWPLDVIKDLEVLDKEKLSAFIQAFVQSNNIAPCSVIIVLSQAVTFEKDFPQVSSEEQDREMQKFIDFVPFEEVISRIIKLEKKLKIVAINKELYESIRDAFEKQGFSIISVVPASVLQETMPELAENLDLSMILSKADDIKQYSLLIAEEPRNTTYETKKTWKNKKTLLLFGVFGILLIILIVLIFTSVLSGPSPKKIINKPTPTIPAGYLNPSPLTSEVSTQGAIIQSTPSAR